MHCAPKEGLPRRRGLPSALLLRVALRQARLVCDAIRYVTVKALEGADSMLFKTDYGMGRSTGYRTTLPHAVCAHACARIAAARRRQQQRRVGQSARVRRGPWCMRTSMLSARAVATRLLAVGDVLCRRQWKLDPEHASQTFVIPLYRDVRTPCDVVAIHRSLNRETGRWAALPTSHLAACASTTQDGRVGLRRRTCSRSS